MLFLFLYKTYGTAYLTTRSGIEGGAEQVIWRAELICGMQGKTGEDGSWEGEKDGVALTIQQAGDKVVCEFEGANDDTADVLEQIKELRDQLLSNIGGEVVEDSAGVLSQESA